MGIKPPSILTFVTLLAMALSVSCVSVKLAPNATWKSTDISYDKPSSPFEEIHDVSLDHAWKNPNNGNSMGFLTECGSNTESSTKIIERDSLSLLSNMQIVETKALKKDGGDGVSTVAAGKVDKTSVRMHLVVLRKDSCNFILTYVGAERNFEADHAQFNTFIEEFDLP